MIFLYLIKIIEIKPKDEAIMSFEASASDNAITMDNNIDNKIETEKFQIKNKNKKNRF